MSDFVGFVGSAYQAPSITQDAQRLENWYPEVDATKEGGERGVVALYPTPGLNAIVQPFGAASEVRGMWVLPGGQSFLAVCGNYLFLINSSLTSTIIGMIATSTGIVSISDNGVQAMIADGVNRYSYTIATKVLTTLPSTDGAFTGADIVDEIDGFLIYNNPGSAEWGCTTNLLSTSPQLSFGSKFSSSDYLISLISVQRQAFLFGERTTEVWVNVGTFPFPFAIVPGTSLQHGCAAKNSVSRLGESCAFLSKDTRGQAIVIQLVGYTPKRISTHAIENDISGGVISDAIGMTYQENGHEFYMLTFPTQDKTWCYDIATNMWHRRTWRDNQNVTHRHRANCCISFQGMILIGDWQNGFIYQMSQSFYTDNGQPILRLRRTPHLTKDLNYVYYNKLQVQFQPGVGLVSGQGSNPQMILRWSNDGGETWTTPQYVSIGAMGNYKNRAIKRRLGYARDRVFEVSITDPVWAVIVSADLDVELGSN